MPKNPNNCYDVVLSSGNLPKYKVNDNNCNIDISKITMNGVTLNKFRYHHMRCPFDSNPVGIDELHMVRNTNPFSSNYWNFEITIPPSQRAYHTTTSGIMAKWSRGSKHGWLCVDDECPYYKGIIVTYNGVDVIISKPGDRYFYY